MIIATRDQLSEGLTKLGFDVLPSAANFVFASHPGQDAEKLYLRLKAGGILVRYFNKPIINNWLRITVGTDQETSTFLKTLEGLL